MIGRHLSRVNGRMGLARAPRVVVLGGAGVGVAGEDLGIAERDAGVQGMGDAAWRNE